MDNVNIVYERKNTDGTSDYVVSLGTVLYNDRIINLSNLVIPIRQQSFFDLPGDKGKYAAVNVYYGVDSGIFVFDTAKKDTQFIQQVSAEAVSNCLPVAQFIIQESFGKFVVSHINQFSKMSTFSFTQRFELGDQGLQGPVGDTGAQGYTGAEGFTGQVGLIGPTGIQGLTGLGLSGATGLQGDTGYYPSFDMLFYGKFKSDDVRLTDYSVQERDFGWGASGAGYYAVEYTSPGVTGLVFINKDPSYYTVEEGIIDNCHSIVYEGGWSSYKSRKYIGFTGTIQAWVQLDIPPQADFTYVRDPVTSLKFTFTDTSLFFPTSWEWQVDGGSPVVSSNFTYIFATHGSHLVSLKAHNASGMSERVKTIVV